MIWSNFFVLLCVDLPPLEILSVSSSGLPILLADRPYTLIREVEGISCSLQLGRKGRQGQSLILKIYLPQSRQQRPRTRHATVLEGPVPFTAGMLRS